MIEILQNLIFIFASLADDLSDCFASKYPLQYLNFFLIFGVALNFIKSSIEELMSILLDVSIDGFPLMIFDCQAKDIGVIVLLLAPLQVNIHLLQLVQEIINHFHLVDLRLLFLWLQRHYQGVELLYHEELLKN